MIPNRFRSAKGGSRGYRSLEVAMSPPVTTLIQGKGLSMSLMSCCLYVSRRCRRETPLGGPCRVAAGLRRWSEGCSASESRSQTAPPDSADSHSHSRWPAAPPSRAGGVQLPPLPLAVPFTSWRTNFSAQDMEQRQRHVAASSSVDWR